VDMSESGKPQEPRFNQYLRGKLDPFSDCYQSESKRVMDVMTTCKLGELNSSFPTRKSTDRLSLDGWPFITQDAGIMSFLLSPQIYREMASPAAEAGQASCRLSI
jgi:hypothetical protein